MQHLAQADGVDLRKAPAPGRLLLQSLALRSPESRLGFRVLDLGCRF